MQRRHWSWVAAAVLLVVLWAWSQRTDDATLYGPDGAPAAVDDPRARTAQTARLPAATAAHPQLRIPEFLPDEARPVLEDIARGGPFHYPQDGGVFRNREGLLPPRPRGYYREFTVATPGAGDRGARRIVTGGDPPVEYFYSDDHYRSFRRFELHTGAVR